MIEQREIDIRLELERVAGDAKQKFREGKVLHLLWYLIDGRDKDDKRVVERAIELASDIRLIDRLIRLNGDES